ncbi:hypothetical protein [uncultured Pseudodesulfovibrio sp.]|uniref:hypothetical protein n=1 Tax=uncultured Pseudodesulfovibrio sp. TaxID=2035858 RepID=UPI0029C853BC|nr:hypothetical protein [uncultured Pseudodesulfovibrio sp.]
MKNEVETLTPEDLIPLERNSWTLPHPMSMKAGYVVTHAGLFALMPEGSEISRPFPHRWGAYALAAPGAGEFCFGKGIAQGVAAYALTPDLPSQPDLPGDIFPMTYTAPTADSACRKMTPSDGEASVRDSLWAVPAFENAGDAFMQFKRSESPGRGDMFLQVDPVDTPGVLVLYHIPSEHAAECEPVFYPVGPDASSGTPIGSTPSCSDGYLFAVLLRESCAGCVSSMFSTPLVLLEKNQGQPGCDALRPEDTEKYYGRQAYPDVYVEHGLITSPENPAEMYAVLREHMKSRKTADMPVSMVQFVREFEGEVAAFEQGEAVSREDMAKLWSRLVATETRLLPRSIDRQTLVRQLLRVKTPQEAMVPCDAMSIFLSETEKTWGVLREIRFQRLPALEFREKKALRACGGTQQGPYEGIGDYIPTGRDGGYFLSEPEANALWLADSFSVSPVTVSGPWNSIGKVRADSRGAWLLDTDAQTLFLLSHAGDVLEEKQFGPLAIGPGTLTDFIVVGEEVYLLYMQDDSTSTVYKTPSNGHEPRLLFHLDGNVYPFESWEWWRGNLLFWSSKGAVLNLYSLSDESWEQVRLPVSHSYAMGLHLVDDLLFIAYSPLVLVYDLAHRRLLHSIYAPEVVGAWPLAPRTFGAQRTETGFRLAVSSKDGFLVHHDVVDFPEV